MCARGSKKRLLAACLILYPLVALGRELSVTTDFLSVHSLLNIYHLPAGKRRYIEVNPHDLSP